MTNEKMLEAGQETEVECPRCGFMMKRMQACHLFCANCGGHYDCSDKGGVW
ncbi:MAG TPA: hypothetical protein VGQ03_07600 [Nitrososphaera sp.]|nr:hypothetical protein [Nitrososphaera sp.]